MENKRAWLIITGTLLLTLFYLQLLSPVNIASGAPQQTIGDLRTNRLILNTDNVTFTQNETLFIYMSIENIVNETIFDVSLNYTYKEDVYEIEASSNTTQTSTEFVSYYWDKLDPGDLVTFNMTIKILTNETNNNLAITAVEIEYSIGEFKLPTYVLANELIIKTFTYFEDVEKLPDRVYGFSGSDIQAFVLFFIFPVLIGFGLNFFFGFRQRR